MKNNLLLLFFFPTLLWGQNISIDPRNFNSGNIELIRAVNENRNIKGNPYLDEAFSNSIIKFKDGVNYEGMLRFNIGKDVFELKSKNTDEIYEFKLTQGITVVHLNKEFETKMLSSENKLATFEILIKNQPYSLYKYHKKIIKEPRKDVIAMPSSNQGNDRDAYWSEQSILILMTNNSVYQIENSHKKMIKSGLVNVNNYNAIIKKNNYKLDKTEDVIKLIKELNSKQ